MRKIRFVRRSIAIILCLMLAATLLSGCSLGVETDDTSAGGSILQTEEVRSEEGSGQAESEASDEVPAETDPEEGPSPVEESAEVTKPSNDSENTSSEASQAVTETVPGADAEEFNLSAIPAYSGDLYVVVNNNNPYFGKAELTTSSFEEYSALDSLGRCGTAYACVGTDLMPTEERGSIGSVKPTGWHSVKYDCVDGKYLYNRCHLIGYQLSGENANNRNLITGTRYLNTEGMLPFENLVADYVKETKNHVLYRVTPVFEENNLLATGVLMEGYSVEDQGDGVCFCVFVYNVQPGVYIDYATGDSHLSEETVEKTTAATTAATAEKTAEAAKTTAAATEEPTTKDTETATTEETAKTTESSGSGEYTYTYSKNSNIFHYSLCFHVDTIKQANKRYSNSREDLIASGMKPCKDCNP